jgi:DNA adenine methylase
MTVAPHVADLRGYREALRPWSFTSMEFDALPLEPGDFVSADPPYDVEFRQYAARGFSWGNGR